MITIEELIERLEGDSSGPYYDALTSYALRREVAQALRVLKAEIEELKDQVETWECDNYNRQIGGE